jgi:hypothetical protein
MACPCISLEWGRAMRKGWWSRMWWKCAACDRADKLVLEASCKPCFVVFGTRPVFPVAACYETARKTSCIALQVTMHIMRWYVAALQASLLPFREGACKDKNNQSPDRDIHASFLCGDDVTMHVFTRSLSKELSDDPSPGIQDTTHKNENTFTKRSAWEESSFFDQKLRRARRKKEKKKVALR